MSMKSKVIAVITVVTLSGVAAVLPFAAMADTTIATLTAQIAALQAQLAALSASTSSSSAACTFTNDLTVGSRGDAVKCLQGYLTSTGHFTYSGGATGYFGSVTKAAVSAWQAANGVSPSAGYFGAKSRAKYSSVVAVTPVVPPVVPPVGPPVVVAGSGLTVAAADQPAATLAPLSAARVPFTKATFTASSDGDVTVTATVERQGLANDSNFSGIVLIGDDGVQIGLEKTLNTNHQAIMDSFVVKAGTSKIITVAGNMSATVNAGEVAKLAIVAVKAGSATVNGTFPIAGNGMTINGTLGIGTLASPTRGTLDPGAAQSSLQVGTTAFYASGVRYTVGSNEPVVLEQVRWYQAGSAAGGDLANVKVTIKGVDYDAAISSDGKYYVVKFGTGLVFDKGATVDMAIKADVLSGSGRTIDFDVQRRTDIVVRGQTYGYYVIPTNGSSVPTANTGAFSSSEPYYDAFSHTISKGTLRLEKSNNVTATNVALDVSNTVLGSFGFEAKGEAIQVTSFTLGMAVTGSVAVTDIDNVSMYDENGSVVAGPKDIGSAGTAVYTDTFTVPVGYYVYTVKGKLTSGNAVNGDTVIASTTPNVYIVAKGQTTGLTVSPTPSSAVQANAQTIRTAALSLSVSPSPSAQNVVSGVNGFVFANYQFDATASGEDIRITSFKGQASFTTETDVNNCQLFDGTVALNTGSNVKNPSGDTSADPVTFTLDNALIIPKGTSKIVALKCNVVSGATSGNTYSWGLKAGSTPTAAGKDTGTSVTASMTASTGNQMVIKTKGSVTIVLDQSSPTTEIYGISGKTDALLGVLKFHATDEAIVLNRIGLTLSSSTASTSDLVKATLWDGATKVGEAVFQGGTTVATSTLSANFIIPRDGDKLLTIKADLASLGVNQPATRGHLISINYNASDTYTAYGTGQASGSQINPSAGTNTAGVGVRLVKTYPTLARLSVASNTLNNSEMVLYRFSVSADPAGDVGIAKITFRITSTTAATTSAFKLYAYSDSAFSVNAYAQNPPHSRNVGKVGDTVWDQRASSTDRIAFFFNPVGNSTPSVVFDTNTSKPGTIESLNVPAGSTRYFELRGTIASSAAGDSITVALQGDASNGVNTNTVDRNKAEAAQTTDSDLIWSPNTTTTAATTSDDWINGYQLPGLPNTEMTGQVFSK